MESLSFMCRCFLVLAHCYQLNCWSWCQLGSIMDTLWASLNQMYAVDAEELSHYTKFIYPVSCMRFLWNYACVWHTRCAVVMQTWKSTESMWRAPTSGFHILACMQCVILKLEKSSHMIIIMEGMISNYMMVTPTTLKVGSRKWTREVTQDISSATVVQKIVVNGSGDLCIQGMSLKRNRKIDGFSKQPFFLYVIPMSCCDLEPKGGKKLDQCYFARRWMLVSLQM